MFTMAGNHMYVFYIHVDEKQGDDFNCLTHEIHRPSDALLQQVIKSYSQRRMKKKTHWLIKNG